MFDVGKRITELRQSKGITVNKLANLAGISQSFLRDIELGNKKPTVEYLEYICYALNISLCAFFESESDKEALSVISHLDNRQKEKLLDFLKTVM